MLCLKYVINEEYVKWMGFELLNNYNAKISILIIHKN